MRATKNITHFSLGKEKIRFCQAQGQTWNVKSKLDPEIGFVMGWSTTTTTTRPLFLSWRKVRWWSGGQVNVRWTSGEVQVKFKISYSRLGKVWWGLGEGQMMVRWSGECQVNVKSQSELDIGGRETCKDSPESKLNWCRQPLTEFRFY